MRVWPGALPTTEISVDSKFKASQTALFSTSHRATRDAARSELAWRTSRFNSPSVENRETSAEFQSNAGFEVVAIGLARVNGTGSANAVGAGAIPCKFSAADFGIPFT